MVVVRASFGRARWWKDFAVLTIASVFLANVFLPHLPAAVMARGYAPGILTALMVHLPFTLCLLWTAGREAVMPVRHVVGAGVCGLITLPLGIFAALTLARLLLGSP